MLYIAIGDDEKYFRQSIKENIANYLEKRGILYGIDEFTTGKELIELGIESMKYKVIFLDINMKEMDGIQTAKEIRKISKEILIVFVTAYINYTLEGYKVDAIRYLLKDSKNFPNAMEECLDALIERLDYKIVKKQFEFNEGIKEISIDRIIYIESKLHKLEFHIMEEEMKLYTMYKTLNKIEIELQESGFVRSHQSFLVNLKYIKDIIRYKVILKNEKEFAIPKTRYRDVKESFIAYKGEI